MSNRDHTQLLAELAEEYARHSPTSAALNARALEHMPDGGSHNLRLIQPFPPRIVSAHGARVRDEDGHDILDFWQGHYTNILGHNPQVVTAELARTFESGFGLQTGFTDRLQVEVAEILCRQSGAEQVRFTTSGTLATLYAILLARAFTGRSWVLKVGGGWHGSQPWALKGVHFFAGDGFGRMESAGLPPAVGDEVLVTRFNDPERLRADLARHGDRIACLIVEPFVGAGGFTPATREYLQAARELTQQHGILLILDEVIAGFRFRAGNLGKLYGVQPDLATFGKIIGGGMPVAAVAGRRDILALAGREGGRKVGFSGGTYSAHPASFVAAKAMLRYLVEHEAEVYPRLAELGRLTRRTMEAAFAEEGIYAHCTGDENDALPGSSMAMLHFPYEKGHALLRPDDVFDPALCDVALTEKVLQLAFLLEDVHVVHGLGAVSMAHTEADIAYLGEACHRVARRIKPHL